MDQEATDPREREFHSMVREYVVCGLILLSLCVFSFFKIIRKYRKDTRQDDLYAGDEGDQLVYRIAVFICTCSMAVSIGAGLLLPCSILGNEIILRYPNNYYWQWLNTSLVHSLWNYIFLLSNSCLMFLLFSYFLIESQGFAGMKGVRNRFYEAIVLCILTLVAIIFIGHIISYMIGKEQFQIVSLLDLYSWYQYQLPLIYSYVSLFGVVLLLICTPVGIGSVFTAVQGMSVSVQPKLRSRKKLEEELHLLTLEYGTLERKLQSSQLVNGTAQNGSAKNGSCSSRETMLERLKEIARLQIELGGIWNVLIIETQKRSKRRHFLLLLSNLVPPIVMLLLAGLTGITVVMVFYNTFQLFFTTTPSYKRYVELGNQSSSQLGMFGALLQVVIIIYLADVSLVGFYSIFSKLKPVERDTSITKVIGNCMALLILSSALPVLGRTIGITNFDLLGAFGRIDWLGNFYLVLAYNFCFGLLSGVCLFHKFSAPVRTELRHRLIDFWLQKSPGRDRLSSSVSLPATGNSSPISLVNNNRPKFE